MQPTKADLLAFALALPEAWEDHPWGESVAKVGKKVFVFFGDTPRSGRGASPSSCASRTRKQARWAGPPTRATAWAVAVG